MLSVEGLSGSDATSFFGVESWELRTSPAVHVRDEGSCVDEDKRPSQPSCSTEVFSIGFVI